ncbi:MAG: hypothetical protein AAGI01_08040, partial [Myxococcota bacterium]
MLHSKHLSAMIDDSGIQKIQAFTNELCTRFELTESTHASTTSPWYARGTLPNEHLLELCVEPESEIDKFFLTARVTHQPEAKPAATFLVEANRPRDAKHSIPEIAAGSLRVGDAVVVPALYRDVVRALSPTHEHLVRHDLKQPFVLTRVELTSQTSAFTARLDIGAFTGASKASAETTRVGELLIARARLIAIHHHDAPSTLLAIVECQSASLSARIGAVAALAQTFPRAPETSSAWSRYIERLDRLDTDERMTVMRALGKQVVQSKEPVHLQRLKQALDTEVESWQFTTSSPLFLRVFLRA